MMIVAVTAMVLLLGRRVRHKAEAFLLSGEKQEPEGEPDRHSSAGHRRSLCVRCVAHKSKHEVHPCQIDGGFRV